MNLIAYDNVLKNPKSYIKNIHSNEFQDIYDGHNVFKNIQPRDNKDEFSKYMLELFPNYNVSINFIRKSPLHQHEPNFVHTDEMMGDITCILYLNEEAPTTDGTTIYDESGKPFFRMYSKFNRVIAFNSDASHSRNILENFGEDENARLVQIIFLKEK
jgi:hypothetical protein